MSGSGWSRREFFERTAATWIALHLGGAVGGVARASQGDGDRRLALSIEQPTKLRELRLLTPRPAELVPFYRDRLGLPVLAEGEDAVAFRAGSSRLVFRRGDEVEKPTPYYHVAFNIPENKLERAVAWTGSRFPLIHRRGAGDPIVHFPHWNAHAIYFWDPAGNLLELIARHELKNASEGPFGAADILAASEIGVVVDDVPATVDHLGDLVGAAPYPAGQPISDGFAAVGDATGLFIVVRRERIWLMTEDLPARVFPTEIVLAGPKPGLVELPDLPYTLLVE
jgi:catechol 2,3-dioxygenase-like lactoylglutathione lyase family enzyme